jgi:hypothetical protein
MRPPSPGRFLALPAVERRLRLRGLVALAAASAALRAVPFRWVRSAAEAAARRGAGAPPRDVERSLRSAARFVPGSTCLARALAARVLLGPDARLLLGVGRDAGGAFAAHAWAEGRGGEAVGDPAAPGMVSLPV